MKVLVTGSAGFIGSALSIRLLERGDQVVGIDNHNDYYDPALKEDRLARHAKHENYTHLRIDLTDRSAMEQVFTGHKPQVVINMAAAVTTIPHTYPHHLLVHQIGNSSNRQKGRISRTRVSPLAIPTSKPMVPALR